MTARLRLSQTLAAPRARPAARRRGGAFGDAVFGATARASGVFVLVLLGAMIATLFIGGLPALRHFGPGFLTSDDWDPVQQVFGGAVPIYGTVMTSMLALLFAVPVAFGIAFFLTELAPAW